MSDTANVARGSYRQHFAESPDTAEPWIVDTEPAHGLSGEPISLRWADWLGELGRREVSVPSDDWSIYREKLLRLLNTAMASKESALWQEHVRRAVDATLQTSAPAWISKEGLELFVSAHQLANTAPLPSADGTWQRPALHSGAGIAEPLPHDDRDLQKALSDLDLLNDEAREEELPEPDVEAVANARTLLPRLYAILRARYQVSPTERRGVAIDAPMKWGASVGVECAPDDTVYCFATIDGNSRRAKFYQMDGLPDVFIEKALRDLAAS